MVQEVQSLNKKIESINVQKTRAEAKVEMLRKQLTQEISEYKKNYGVDLSDKSFAKLSGKVKAELSQVTDAIRAEFELKEKVVKAIEDGDYERAYQLLGVEVETEAEAEAEEGTEVVGGTAEVDTEDGDFDFDMTEADEDEVVDVSELIAEEDKKAEKSAVTFDDETDFGVPVVEEDDVDGGVMLDDMVGADKKSVGVKGESALSAVESIGVVDEDDEGDSIPNMDDTDWGFGDILSGTQFDNN